jgi:hypothetical protein
VKGRECHYTDCRPLKHFPGHSYPKTTSVTNRKELEASGIHVGGLGDAGELLDEQAKATYKARLRELREELEEAKEFGDIERAAC